MSDADAHLVERQRAATTAARARRSATVIFAGGQRLDGDQAHLMAQAWSNGGVNYDVVGWEDATGYHEGVPPWFGVVIAQPPPDELERHLRHMEDERRAGRERERARLRGDRLV